MNCKEEQKRIAELEAAHEAHTRQWSRSQGEAEAEAARLREALIAHHDYEGKPHNVRCRVCDKALAGGGQEPNPAPLTAKEWKTLVDHVDYNCECLLPQAVKPLGDEIARIRSEADPVYPRGNDGTDGLEDGHWLYEEGAAL